VLHHHETDRFCTAALMRLRRDADGWQVTSGVGGHPPPLLLRAGSGPEPCGGRGPLLGVLDEATFEDDSFRLGPGDVVLLYTDGVLEGRRGRELFGEDRLVAAVAQAGRRPAALVDGVMSAVLDFQEGTLRDDVAIVAFGVPLAETSG